jgi:hypothetical protein
MQQPLRLFPPTHHHQKCAKANIWIHMIDFNPARVSNDQLEVGILVAPKDTPDSTQTTTSHSGPLLADNDGRGEGPIPLDLKRTQHVSFASALATAHVIENFSQISYPEGITIPRHDLNDPEKRGNFWFVAQNDHITKISLSFTVMIVTSFYSSSLFARASLNAFLPRVHLAPLASALSMLYRTSSIGVDQVASLSIV